MSLLVENMVKLRGLLAHIASRPFVEEQIVAVSWRISLLINDQTVGVFRYVPLISNFVLNVWLRMGLNWPHPYSIRWAVSGINGETDSWTVDDFNL